jgi:hypothetical protein
MATKTDREITICQGNKKELEEITGREYEYFPLEEVQAFNKESGGLARTYIETERGVWGNEKEFLIERMYSVAQQIEADAIIHYSSDYTLAGRRGCESGYSFGTPLRLKYSSTSDSIQSG